MNTIVFILMMWNGHAWMPALSFNDQRKCDIAAESMNKKIIENNSRPPAPWCIRIDK